MNAVVAKHRSGSGLRRPLPGFGLGMGLGLGWLGVIVLLPLAALLLHAAGLGITGWLRALHDERVQAAVKLSFGASFAAALVAALAGTLVAWVVVRYRFPGRRLLDAAEDAACAEGIKAMEMTVIDSRDTLIAWYERRGYVRTGETRPFPVLRDPPITFVVLEKPLAAP